MFCCIWILQRTNETAHKLLGLCRVRNPGPLERKAPRRLSIAIKLQSPRSNAAHSFSPVLLVVARPTALCRALVCVAALRCAITALWLGDTTASHCEARSLVPSGAENYLLASNCRPSDYCSKTSSDRQTDTVSSIIILMKWNLYVYFIVFEAGELF
jgi:hypothetical protein